jgi:caffeoyl-CoA O-methyltransferase
MAAGLPQGGRITTLEADPDHVELSRHHIAASPYADRIEVVPGPALDSLAHLEGPFDLVFIDADKVNYDGYYEAVLPKLSPRGVILCDNTLYGGGVLDGGSGERAADANAEALRRFNEKVVADPRVVCAMTTIRDGVTLIRRAPD